MNSADVEKTKKFLDCDLPSISGSELTLLESILDLMEEEEDWEEQ